MAKKYEIAPGVEILFDRRVVVEVEAPKSGRMVKIEDVAPEILAVSLGDATVYYERTAEGWRDMSCDPDDVIAGIIEEDTAADEAKRAPKF